ncbi:hypothetical protein K435DRAFT_791262 [Dendrothele bispora CBS 962.96]|uniref:Uncharacterized protein n=1 Tax=Dendrothele bispora (strain CBS 962.96) TaxID=1314807 RepID=A0A4S8MMD6_DENBC|nr:hypothetical protein K435DRAFT_791262 [Dendrothele bispora CBS 962.96]
MLLLWMFRTGACHLGESIKTLLIEATLTQIPKGSSGSDATDQTPASESHRQSTSKIPSFLKTAKDRLSARDKLRKRAESTTEAADTFSPKFDPAVKTNAEALQMPHGRPDTKKRKNKKSTAPSADHDTRDSGDDRVTKKSKAASNTASTKFTVVLVGDTPAVDAGKATIPTVSQIQNKFGTNEAQFVTITQDDSAEDIKKAVIGAFTASGCPFAGDPAIIQNFTFLFRKSNGRGHQNTLARSTREKIDHDILKGLADHNTANGVNQQFPLRLYISLPSGSPKVSQDGQEELEDNSTDEESTMDTVKDSTSVADETQDQPIDPNEEDKPSSPPDNDSATDKTDEQPNASTPGDSTAICWIPIIARGVFYMESPDEAKNWYPTVPLGPYSRLLGPVERVRITLTANDDLEPLTQVLKDIMRDEDLVPSLGFVVDLSKVMRELSDDDFLSKFCLGPFGLHPSIQVLDIIYRRVSKNKEILDPKVFKPVFAKLGEVALAVHRMLRRFKDLVHVWEYAPPGYRQFFMLWSNPQKYFDSFQYPLEDTEHYNFVEQKPWETYKSKAWFERSIKQDLGSADSAADIDPSKIKRGSFCLDAIFDFMQEFLVHVYLPESQLHKELYSFFSLFCSVLAERVRRITEDTNTAKGDASEFDSGYNFEEYIYVSDNDEDNDNTKPYNTQGQASSSSSQSSGPKPKPKPRARQTAPPPPPPSLPAWERSLNSIREQFVNQKSFKGVQTLKAFEAIYTVFNDGPRHPKTTWSTDLGLLDHRKLWRRMCQIYHSDHAPSEEKTKYDKITALINEIKQEAGF